MTGSATAWKVVLLGVLAFAAMPVAIAATRYSGAYDLVHSAFAIPLALGFGCAAVLEAREARARADTTLGKPDGRTAASIGRVLGIIGICTACSALIALAVYGVLTFSG